VSCPVCEINVPEGNINRHLDDCLSDQQTGKDRPAKSTGNTQTAQPVRSAPSSQPVRLAGNTSFQPSAQSTVLPPQKKSMRPVTKVVYNLMKDAQLRELLKKEGLETKGDRKTLINRHKKFSVLWNAQCEEDSPMSRYQLWLITSDF
jgi:E3 ubiquitin-protein ligase RAD18